VAIWLRNWSPIVDFLYFLHSLTLHFQRCGSVTRDASNFENVPI
jgi:hypothetical protein